jgi:hypothetical protein
MTARKKPPAPNAPPIKIKKCTEHHYFSIDEIRDVLDARVMQDRRTAYRGSRRLLSAQYVEVPADRNKDYIRLTISDTD